MDKSTAHYLLPLIAIERGKSKILNGMHATISLLNVHNVMVLVMRASKFRFTTT